jgi:hypothetical protein
VGRVPLLLLYLVVALAKATSIDKKRKSDGLRNLVIIKKYLKWRNLSVVTVPKNLELEIGTSQVAKLNKRKRINNEEELRE